MCWVLLLLTYLLACSGWRACSTAVSTSCRNYSWQDAKPSHSSATWFVSLSVCPSVYLSVCVSVCYVTFVRTGPTACRVLIPVPLLTVLFSGGSVQWSNYVGARGACPPERLGGPRETCGLIGYKGACKRPHEITHQSMIATYRSNLSTLRVLMFLFPQI